MNWEAIGAIAEIVGSFAVAIPFLYLALQIRQSSKSARSASASQSRMAITDVLSTISSDSEASKVYTTGMATPDSLELHERVRFKKLYGMGR